MKSALFILLTLLCGIVAYHSVTRSSPGRLSARLMEYTPQEDESGLDNDWFMTQRSYPRDRIPAGAQETMRQELRSIAAAALQGKSPTTSSSIWSLAGPTNIGGRFAAVQIDPVNPDIIYAGSASGGIWKSTDFGASWSIIFNEAFSIGALRLDPDDPSTMYVGTGEANPGGVACYPGNGIWRTTDAGSTWSNLGLGQTGHIGKIVVDPVNTNRIYVAALGLYRGKTTERGVYRSTDHGNTWARVFYLNDTTGAIDIVIDPANPNNIIAAMWLRYRTPAKSDLQGGSTGLYRSTDGGDTWGVVASGFPSGAATLGRVSLAFAPSSPATVYALAASGAGWGGIYKSTNAGVNWTQPFVNSSSGEGQVWFNNVITVHPLDAGMFWAGMTYLYQSFDGGATVPYGSFGGSFHVDQHALEYAPSNPDRVVLGNDGGIFTSTDGGENWMKSYNLPVTQFYAGTIDHQNPNRLLGGTQDNNTLKVDNGLADAWYPILGGDGFVPLVDPTDSHYVYAESQNGGLAYSTDGGYSFFGGTNGIGSGDRKNWQTPIAMNLQNPKTLFTGTQYVYRTRNHMQSWTQISGDLTYGNGGRVGTISTIDVAPTDSNVVYVGTDDGRVWVTTNGGTSWTDIGNSLPDRWVTRVTVDPIHPEIAYVTFSGFIVYDFGGHVYRTTNYGTSWSDIGTGLPDIPINDVVVDPGDRSHLYVANDLTVMATTDLGMSWSVFGTGLPEVPVHDLAIHAPTRKLVAFTHGRSAFKTTLPPPSGITTISIAVNNRWNLVSLPMVVGDSMATAVFPGSSSPAYAYDATTGYSTSPYLTPGEGYWMKFPSAQNVVIEGIPVLEETVDVVTGWNLIGSTCLTPSAGLLYSIPSGLIASPVYAYAGAYAEASHIQPGKGYWVKTTGPGKIVIPSSSFATPMRSDDGTTDPIERIPIEFRNEAGDRQQLYIGNGPSPEKAELRYEMPPGPPQGAFDVRYASGRNTVFVSGGEREEYQIFLSPGQGPVRVSSGTTGSLKEIVLRIDGSVLPLAHGMSVTIPPGTRDVRLLVTAGSLPERYRLEQNYPNPFNPTTIVQYDLPEPGLVELEVFDISGRLMGMLFKRSAQAGRHEAVWDASGVAAGVYFYSITVATPGKSGHVFRETRKMIRMK
jgi:photosystem II stability/assembly factor-like uncharacterized protein